MAWMMRWFGAPWGAPVNTTNPECEPPRGATCAHCGKVVEVGECGFVLPPVATTGSDLVYHRDCLQKVIVGQRRADL